MRNGVTLILAGSLGAVGLALTGCDDKKDSSPVGDKVEKAVEKSGEKVGQAVEKTGEAIGRGAQKAAPAIADATAKSASSGPPNSTASSICATRKAFSKTQRSSPPPKPSEGWPSSPSPPAASSAR